VLFTAHDTTVEEFRERHRQSDLVAAARREKAGNLPPPTTEQIEQYYHSHEKEFFTPGDTGFSVFSYRGAQFGMMICFDWFFPEAARTLALLGAEVILWINGRGDGIEDFYCMSAAHAYGCVVGANVSNGYNTGFAEPRPGCITAEGEPEEARLFPRIPTRGDACVSATINLKGLRWWRKHLRQMHQRRPEMYGLLTQPITMWQDYPDVAWDSPDCEKLVNKAQL